MRKQRLQVEFFSTITTILKNSETISHWSMAQEMIKMLAIENNKWSLEIRAVQAVVQKNHKLAIENNRKKFQEILKQNKTIETYQRLKTTAKNFKKFSNKRKQWKRIEPLVSCKIGVNLWRKIWIRSFVDEVETSSAAARSTSIARKNPRVIQTWRDEDELGFPLLQRLLEANDQMIRQGMGGLGFRKFLVTYKKLLMFGYIYRCAIMDAVKQLANSPSPRELELSVMSHKFIMNHLLLCCYTLKWDECFSS